MCSKNTKILKIDDKSLKYAKNLIEGEDLVAFPTETVYGLGALATSDVAVKLIYEAKGRPQDNPLIVHVHKDYDLTKLVYVENDYAYKLMKAFTPGPLTMIYKSKGVVSPAVSCGLDTIGIRIPSHEGCQRFLKYLDLPIAAPSANVSKHTSPVTAEHVFDDLNGKIDLILDGGKCSGGIESTVLDVTTSTPIILRSGLVTRDMIKSVVGKCEYGDSKPTDKVRSPGVKYRHYCPKCETALFKRDELDKAAALYNEYVRAGKKPYYMCDENLADVLIKNGENFLNLGRTGTEVASNLYYKLLEGEKVADIIIAFNVDTGSEVDISVMNRLQKACKPKSDND